MLAPQLDNGSGRRRNASSLGPAAMSPGERALVATVLSAGGRGGVSELVPALMRAPSMITAPQQCQKPQSVATPH
jgi:hypothetical protein